MAEGRGMWGIYDSVWSFQVNFVALSTFIISLQKAICLYRLFSLKILVTAPFPFPFGSRGGNSPKY